MKTLTVDDYKASLKSSFPNIGTLPKNALTGMPNLKMF